MWSIYLFPIQYFQFFVFYLSLLLNCAMYSITIISFFLSLPLISLYSTTTLLGTPLRVMFLLILLPFLTSLDSPILSSLASPQFPSSLSGLRFHPRPPSLSSSRLLSLISPFNIFFIHSFAFISSTSHLYLCFPLSSYLSMCLIPVQ